MSTRKLPAELAKNIADLRARYPIRTASVEQRQKNGVRLIRAIAKLRGGVCMATTFDGTLQKCRLRCKHGHEWECGISHLLRGTWCLICAPQPRRNTMEDMQAAAEKRGGQCLSSTYVNVQTHLQWQCAEGLAWLATPCNILNGKWCPRCRGLMPAEEHHALLAKLAKERGGQLLSPIYVNAVTPLLWSCEQGHFWEANPSSIKINGTWCPTCVGRYTKEEQFARLTQLAKDRGGELLSTHFLSVAHKLTWLCHRGHSWQATASNVKKGTWCRQCTTIERSGFKGARKYLASFHHSCDMASSAKQEKSMATDS
ncbi:hypothetical protein [Collimonas antrihumi]|uniref:hypothetical protein n=1 Tax=Collimonas antrihumi TaxID=1940615 RepID=UPI001B8C1353|nr:hypothetical protein [Collimonas antrihumi]